VLIVFWPVVEVNEPCILNIWYHMHSEVQGEESNLSQVAFKDMMDNLREVDVGISSPYVTTANKKTMKGRKNIFNSEQHVRGVHSRFS
jgi:hypothetical protein